MPKYRVIAHRRVHKFITGFRDKNLRTSVLECIRKLEDYPLTLRKMDAQKIKGVEKAFRIRIGNYRVIFQVDDQRKPFMSPMWKPERKHTQTFSNQS